MSFTIGAAQQLAQQPRTDPVQNSTPTPKRQCTSDGDVYQVRKSDSPSGVKRLFGNQTRYCPTNALLPKGILNEKAPLSRQKLQHILQKTADAAPSCTIGHNENFDITKLGFGQPKTGDVKALQAFVNETFKTDQLQKSTTVHYHPICLNKNDPACQFDQVHNFLKVVRDAPPDGAKISERTTTTDEAYGIKYTDTISYQRHGDYIFGTISGQGLLGPSITLVTIPCALLKTIQTHKE